MVATTATQPVDVLKTRMMNARPGEYKSVMRCFIYTAQTGPFGFFKVGVTKYTTIPLILHQNYLDFIYLICIYLSQSCFNRETLSSLYKGRCEGPLSFVKRYAIEKCGQCSNNAHMNTIFLVS